MSVLRFVKGLLYSALLATMPIAAEAEDMVRLAVGAPNNWDTCISEVGQRAGIFAKQIGRAHV